MQKTFDQILQESTDQKFSPVEIHPNRVIPANIVLEPNTHQGVARVRVTARDAEFKLLWGVNLSESLLPAEHPTPVAIYDRLRQLIREHLNNPAPRHEITGDPFAAVSFCLQRIQNLLNKCAKKTVEVKNKSDETHERAEKVADILFDALRQLTYELSKVNILPPTKQTEEDAQE